MVQTKEDQINYWHEHINRASANNQSLHEYSALNKISKSAIYRWKKYFSDLSVNQVIAERPSERDEDRISPFSALVVETSGFSTIAQSKNRSLPDSAWLAEVIVKVIQGLS